MQSQARRPGMHKSLMCALPQHCCTSGDGMCMRAFIFMSGSIAVLSASCVSMSMHAASLRAWVVSFWTSSAESALA